MLLFASDVDFLVGLFLQDPDALAMGEQMVVWLLLAGPLLGIYYLSSNFLQAAGNALAATVVSVLRQGAILIPALYLMHALLRFTGIAAGHTVADVTAAAIALTVCLLEYRTVSLPSSVNFEYVNKILIPEMHYNNSGMSQFYMRFIRYTSTEYK